MQDFIQKIDVFIITYLRKLQVPVARLAIFTVYFWFGILKLLGASPATPLVQALFDQTIHFMPFPVFYMMFSGLEVFIGILFLIKGMERVAIFLLGFHIITTVLPLFLLPGITWQGFLVPTLEGQYIIKNVLIVAAAIVVGASLVPIRSGLDRSLR